LSKTALRRGIVLLLLTLVVACGGSSKPAAIGHQLLAPAAASALLQAPPQGVVIVDVRTPEEFAAAHIAGAIDIDFNAPSFATEIAKLDRDTIYFVYCHSGNRSAGAVAEMQRDGFRSIYELQGGVAAWQEAGLPLTTS
jgi:rhodanese-related sulfurtransferase